jgi:hypothetical protein
MIIDNKFFADEPTKIANVLEGKDLPKIVAKFIGEYQLKCLKTILGACLAKEVLDSFEFVVGSGYSLKATATTPIKNLVNGFEYDAPTTSVLSSCGCGCGGGNCTKRYWKGFVTTSQYLYADALQEQKKSFIANYVYYHWLLYNRTASTGTGQQILEGENSISAQNFSKRIDAWNEFMFLVVGCRKGETSMYQFLTDNKADYPTWEKNCNLRFKDKW